MGVPSAAGIVELLERMGPPWADAPIMPPPQGR